MGVCPSVGMWCAVGRGSVVSSSTSMLVTVLGDGGCLWEEVDDVESDGGGGDGDGGGGVEGFINTCFSSLSIFLLLW